ncbi:hypothetical protein FIBSPDRAFT_726991 [Athelia psychrophila]|uniref:DUF6533 domain-containing protein n=1 Tax=Athelia psychrophila TaxID=1759441 RepID=A0A166SPF3_9AGAM|nr:hypothetical protein FIBSPDRAFT_726991 [Fibularhizoctonia sp. CBS 109695]
MSPVLNPNTPLAFLPPQVADVFQISAYIYFACVGALTWDWLMSIPDEYRILSTGRISLSKIAYICARVFTLALCLCSAIFVAAPIKNCPALMRAILATNIIALNTNNLLFFFRVRAVYGKSLSVTVLFGFLYFTVFGTTMVTPFSLNAEHIGPTQMCIQVNVRNWLTSVMITNAVNGTLVFLAISYRISSQSMGGDGWHSTWRCFFRGDGAPPVLKDLLYNSQLCYLVMTVMNIALIMLGFKTNYEVTLIIPAMSLENAMTCRVHRAVILGLINSESRRSTSTDAPLMFTTCISGEISIAKGHALDAMTGLESQAGRISKESAADRV